MILEFDLIGVKKLVELHDYMKFGEEYLLLIFQLFVCFYYVITYTQIA